MLRVSVVHRVSSYSSLSYAQECRSVSIVAQIVATMHEAAWWRLLLPTSTTGASSMPERIGSSLQRHIADLVFSGFLDWESLPEGSVNSTWKVRAPDGQAAIVRIGPSASEIERGPSWMRANALGCEQELLALVRPDLASVPATTAVGFRPGTRPWVVQELVPGWPLSRVLPELAAEESTEIWREVGSLVRHLHTIRAPWFGTPDGNERFPTWLAMVMHDVEGLLRDARRWDLPREPFATLAALVQRHVAELSDVARPVIVHSDLDARHIFVERREAGWEISGVIDWEYGRYADPLSESLLVDMLARDWNDPDRIAFLEGYGLEAGTIRHPAIIERQEIYRGIAQGWEVTDAARLRPRDCSEVRRRMIQ